MAVENRTRVPDDPARVTTGLLEHLTAHSLDEDYAEVARRTAPRRDPAAGSRTRARSLVVLVLFGLLVATAAVSTSREAATTQRARAELVGQITIRSSRLAAQRATILRLRGQIDDLQRRGLTATEAGRALATRLTGLGMRTGQLPVTGPGVRVVVDDAPDATGPQGQVLDKDLQKLVNALWESGAEAVSINGQRLTSLSAIRHAGSAITVNYRSLSPPYVVSAIGDPAQMPARFLETRHGAAWLDLQRAYGLRFRMTPRESLTLPAATRLDLRLATSPEVRR